MRSMTHFEIETAARLVAHPVFTEVSLARPMLRVDQRSHRCPETGIRWVRLQYPSGCALVLPDLSDAGTVGAMVQWTMGPSQAQVKARWRLCESLYRADRGDAGVILARTLMGERLVAVAA